MRRLPFLLTVLIVAVLAAGVVGVAIHAPSEKPSGVAAPPTTQAAPSTTEAAPSTTEVVPSSTAVPTTASSSPQVALGRTRSTTTTRPRTSVLGTRTLRSRQRTSPLPSTGQQRPGDALLAAGLLLLCLAIRTRVGAAR